MDWSTPTAGSTGGGRDIWPINYRDVLAALDRIRPHLSPTPLRSYETLDAEAGHGLRILVKHENHNPTNAFKARNGLSVMTALSAEERRRGVVAATRGNHGLGVAWAGRIVGAPVHICVPFGNNPEKNEAMRGLGATLHEEGRDYDEAVQVMERLVRDRGLRRVHSTNDPLVIAGAATLTLEILEQAPRVDALVVAVGLGRVAATLWVGSRLFEEKVTPDPYQAGLRWDEAQHRAAGPDCDISAGRCERLLEAAGARVTLEIEPRPYFDVGDRDGLSYGEKLAEDRPEEVRVHPAVIAAYLGDESD